MCCIHIVFADWSGFPLVTNNVYKYDDARTNYSVISQLLNAVDQRCDAAGIAGPSIVETWTCSAGYSNEPVINIVGSVTNYFTNTYLLTTTVNTTNQIGSFEYTYTDPQGTFTNTAYPRVSHALMASLDAKILTLIPYFVDTNEIDTNGTFDTWFGTGETEFPMLTASNLFSQLSIGFTTNGYTWWSRSMPVTQNWMIAELEHTNTAWGFTAYGTFGRELFDRSVFPELRYTAGGVNPMVSLTVAITGTVMGKMYADYNYSWYEYPTSEVVVINADSVELSNQWFRIIGMTCTDTPANSNDVLSIVWDDYVPLYGTGFEYKLSAEVLDERYKGLNELRQTTEGMVLYQGTNYSWVWYGDSGYESNWPVAKATAETNWVSLMGTNAFSKSIGSYGIDNNDVGPHASNIAAYASAFQAQNSVTNLATNIAKEIDFYILSSVGPLAPVSPITSTNLYTNWNFNLREDLYTYFNSATGAVGYHSVTSVTWGTQIWNYTWCPEPFNSSGVRVPGRSCLGFDLKTYTQRALIDWAVTNGFTQQ